jgi:hypothetical protein
VASFTRIDRADVSHIRRIHYTVVVARNPPCNHRGQFSAYELPFSKPSNRSVDDDRFWHILLYGLAVRCKGFFVDLVGDDLASMYPASRWSVAPGHHGYQRACDLVSG